MKRRSLVGMLVLLSFGSFPAFAAPAGAKDRPVGKPPARYALSSEDRWILDRGEIGTGAYVVGGLTGTFFGLGIGHAVQGRYSRNGWIFTVGELASAALVVGGASDCWDDALGNESCSNGAVTLGVVALLGFRIWEVIDVWAGPPEHNRAYRSLKARENDDDSLSFYLLPLPTQAVAGLQYRF